MTQNEFALLSLGRKAPDIPQLLDVFKCSRLMTRQALEDKVCELALACCRLQQEVLGFEAMRSESKQRSCVKCSGGGMVQRWTGEHVECDACDAKGF